MKKELGKQLKEPISAENQKILDRYHDAVNDGFRKWLEAQEDLKKLWTYIIEEGGY